jgi:hypothetical protein
MHNSHHDRPVISCGQVVTAFQNGKEKKENIPECSLGGQTETRVDFRKPKMDTRR